MTVVIGFPPQTVYFITGISQAKPGTVTLTSTAETNAFPLGLGFTVTISKVVGMNQINGKRYIVGNINIMTNTFDLYHLDFTPADTTNFIPYISGGQVNIISFPATATQPPGLMYNNQPN